MKLSLMVVATLVKSSVLEKFEIPTGYHLEYLGSDPEISTMFWKEGLTGIFKKNVKSYPEENPSFIKLKPVQLKLHLNRNKYWAISKGKGGVADEIMFQET